MRIAHLDGDPYLTLTLPPKEPLCAVCEQPIQWCLDMFSFTTGPDRRLAHARCVWTKEAFRREERRAPSVAEVKDRHGVSTPDTGNRRHE